MSPLAHLFLAMLGPCVVYAWARSAFPWVQRRRRAVLAALVGFGLIQLPSYWLVLRERYPFVGAVHFGIVVIAVVMTMTSPLLVLLLGATRVAGKLRTASGERHTASGERHTASGERHTTSGERPPDVRRRQVIEATAGTALFGMTGGVLGWGITRGRHEYQVIEVSIPIAGLPRSLDGYAIVQVSDIHAGELVGPREVAEGFALARRAKPDLLVVTGDMVDFEASYGPFIARAIADVPTRDGVFAILGNHDYYGDARAVLAAMRGAGVTPLVNAGRVIRPGDGGGFALLGVDDWSARFHGGRGPDLRAALADVPADRPRILLSHQPHTIHGWAGQVQVQLSGHTHGGQINPGGLVDPLFQYVAGRYAVRGTTLYVNRGFGTVGPPARVGVPPEVTRIVLVAA